MHNEELIGQIKKFGFETHAGPFDINDVFSTAIIECIMGNISYDCIRTKRVSKSPSYKLNVGGIKYGYIPDGYVDRKIPTMYMMWEEYGKRYILDNISDTVRDEFEAVKITNYIDSKIYDDVIKPIYRDHSLHLPDEDIFHWNESFIMTCNNETYADFRKRCIDNLIDIFTLIDLCRDPSSDDTYNRLFDKAMTLAVDILSHIIKCYEIIETTKYVDFSDKSDANIVINDNDKYDFETIKKYIPKMQCMITRTKTLNGKLCYKLSVPEGSFMKKVLDEATINCCYGDAIKVIESENDVVFTNIKSAILAAYASVGEKEVCRI